MSFAAALSLLAPMPAAVSFADCYAANKDRVYRWAMAYALGSTAFAEDLTQDVFVRLYENYARLEQQEDLGGWLYRVTANLALNRVERELSTTRKLSAWLVGESEEAPAPNELLEEAQAQHQAQVALAGLPPKERVVMTLKHVEGRSQQEVAELLQMSKGYVSKLVTRACTRLQKAGWKIDHE